MIRVNNKVKVYEQDNVQLPVNENVELVVESHWNRDDCVVLIVDGKKYTVIGKDLHAAIINAKNCARY
jgi:hypothetical protein